MGRAVLEQPVVVFRLRVSPATVGVVAGLLRQQRRLVDIEVDGAIVVGRLGPIVQRVHPTRVGRSGPTREPLGAAARHCGRKAREGAAVAREGSPVTSQT